jgi:hypothetical protein
MSFQHSFVEGFGVEKRKRPPHLLCRILLVLGLFVLGMQAASAEVLCTQSNGQWTCTCTPKRDNTGYIYQGLDESNQKPWQSAQTAPDLIVGLVQSPAFTDVILQKCQHLRRTQSPCSFVIL